MEIAVRRATLAYLPWQKNPGECSCGNGQVRVKTSGDAVACRLTPVLVKLQDPNSSSNGLQQANRIDYMKGTFCFPTC